MNYQGYKGYKAKVEFDEEANVLRGEIAGIRDLITFQANDVKQLEKEFRFSVDDYLKYCEETGHKPGKPYSGKFVVRVGADLHRKLEAESKKSNTSLNSLIKNVLSERFS